MRYLKLRKLKIYCNMNNIFLVAGIISVIFLIFKFLEMRYININIDNDIDNEPKPLKFLIRDSLLVYISVVIGSFLLDQLKPVMNEIVVSEVPLAFTDNPPF
jgi:hypothetical protein